MLIGRDKFNHLINYILTICILNLSVKDVVKKGFNMLSLFYFINVFLYMKMYSKHVYDETCYISSSIFLSPSQFLKLLSELWDT